MELQIWGVGLEFGPFTSEEFKHVRSTHSTLELIVIKKKEEMQDDFSMLRLRLKRSKI